MSMSDMAGGPPQNDPSRSMMLWYLMQNQNKQGQNQNQTLPGALGNSLMSAMLMNPDMFKQVGAGIGNLLSGATQSAWSQQANPYGATGNGMAPIVGSTGMVGGGA